MFFAGEDELAIHTVASAAYRLVADLKVERGQDEAADCYKAGIFYIVRDYRRGVLPSRITNNPEVMNGIRELAETISMIDAATEFGDIAASVSSDVARKFWQERNKVANFLKHADRDARSLVGLEEVDNLQLLVQTFGAYLDLSSGELGAEGLVLWLYFNVAIGDKETLRPDYQGIAAKIEGLAPAEQLDLCSVLIREMTQIDESNFSVNQ